MSRRVHTVVQLFLVVLWVVVLATQYARSVSSQSCSNPPYLYTNPLRNFWDPNIGNITVKIDERFTTHYPSVPDAVERIQGGHSEWNNLDMCASEIEFSDFGTRSFTESEINSPAPFGRVYWIVNEPNTGSYAGITSNFNSSRVVSATVKVSPDRVRWTQLNNPYTFNHLGTHEIGHSFNLGHCTSVCTPDSIMGGATFGPSDATGPGICDIQNVSFQYCPTPTPTPSPSATVEPLPTPCEDHCPGIVAVNQACFGPADPCSLPENDGCQTGLFNISGCCCYAETPVLIDVLGDGFNLTSPTNGVNFDVDINGTPERVSWTATNSDDAWLVLDRNGNGLIDSGGELFGNHTAQPEPAGGNARNGFLALAEFDKAANGGNEDGFITEADDAFNSLLLWQDLNHNGTSESIELKTLASFGLAKIELEYKRSRRVDINGNIFLFRAKIRDSKDAQMGRWAWDVVLAKDQ